MRKPSLFVLSLWVAASVMAAESGTKETVASAAKKLAEKANYSWTQTTELEGVSSNFRMGPVQGQIEKGGYAFYSGTFGDNSYAAAFKGEKSAFRGLEDWQSLEELEGSDQGAWVARRLKAFKAPAAEAAEMAGKAAQLTKGDDGVYAGELTDEGVKELLGRWSRRTASDAKDAKGKLKFWLKDGMLTKYEYSVRGTFAQQDSGEEVKRSWTSTVEIKGVGTTTVSVPEEAKKKLN